MTTRRYTGTWAISIDIDEPADVDPARRHDYQEELMRELQALIDETRLVERMCDRLGAMLDGRHADRVAISPFPISHPVGGRTWHGARRPERRRP